MRKGQRFAASAATRSEDACSRRQWLARAVAGVAAAGVGRNAHAVRIGDPDTSRRVRQQAAAAIPLRQLTPAARRRVAQVVEQPTLFRRMPTEQIICAPELFVFLVRYPEVVVNMWSLMGATKLSVDRVADYVLDSNDGAGTKTRLELIYGSRKQHLMFADGLYSGPLFRRQLVGKSVLTLHSSFARNARGEQIVNCTLDAFVSLENTGIDFVAKTLHPLMGKTADHNFSESARFVSQVSEQVERNPAGMQRLCGRLSKVEPAIRAEFASIIDNVARSSADSAGGEKQVASAAAPPPATPSKSPRASLRR